MKTYAIWLLMTWTNQNGLVLQQPYFPTFQECEGVRKVAEEFAPAYVVRGKCIRVDVRQTVEHMNTTR